MGREEVFFALFAIEEGIGRGRLRVCFLVLLIGNKVVFLRSEIGKRNYERLYF